MSKKHKKSFHKEIANWIIAIGTLLAGIAKLIEALK